jgi:iron complex outermembrane receptor protein
MTQNRYANCTGIALVLAAAVAAPAWGQDSAEVPGEIVVTAQKREQRLQNVPVSVTAVSGATLTGRQIFDPMQLPQIAPSLQQQNQPHQASGVAGSIRGVGTAVFTEGVESSVSTVIDGVSYGRPEMAVVQLFDLDRVEVLEGPQGTLFGKNASAGVVSIVTKNPKLGVVEGMAHLAYGNSSTPSAGNEVVAQLAVNVPVSANSAVRLAGFVTYRDPIVKNVYTDEGDYGQTQFGLRGKYLWEPDDRWRILIGADAAHNTGAGLSAYTNGSVAPGGLLATLTDTYVPEISQTTLNTKVADDLPKYLSFTSLGGFADINYEMPSGLTVNNLAAYRYYTKKSGGDVDHLPLNVFNINAGTKHYEQFSDELKIASPAGKRLEYVAGLYFFKGIFDSTFAQGGNLEGLNRGTAPVGMSLIGNFADRTTRSTSVAAFAQGTFRIVDPLRIIVGGRVTHDTLRNIGTLSLGNNVIALSALGSYDYRVEETAFSYKLGAQYDLSRDIMAYVNYTRGYKAPGLTDTPGSTSPIVKKEIPIAWEIGLKTQWFDRRITLNLSAWDETFKDFQAQAFSQFSVATLLLNAGSLKSRGAQVELSATPVAGLSLHANAAYIDAYYKSFKGNPCYPGEVSGTSGSNVCLPNGSSDATGNPLQNASKFSYTMSAQYDVPLSDSLDAFASMNWYHRSKTNYSANLDPKTAQAGYGLLGGSVGVKGPDEKWKLSIYGRNILDKRFAGWIVRNPIDGAIGDAAKGGDYFTFFTPDSFRTVGLSFDVKF